MSTALELGDFLGRGNFGKVYRAVWNGKQVAAKQFTLRGEDALIQEEIKTYQELVHPNVIHMLGLELYNHTWVMVMELCENGSLKAALQGRLALDWNAKTRIAREAAEGLAFLHSHNVLHRDLRSSNVLLDANVSVRLTDFGIPKIKTTTAAKAHGQRGEGTLRWMAPELLSIKPKYSNKSDVYALGMVMWEMAAERVLPYGSDENNGFVTEYVKKGGREKIPEGAPEDYASFIKKCWEHEPADRPEASEMASKVSIAPATEASSPTGAKAAGSANASDSAESSEGRGGKRKNAGERVKFSDKPPLVRTVSVVELDIEDYDKDGEDDDDDDDDFFSPRISSEKLARLDIGKSRIDSGSAKKDTVDDKSKSTTEAETSATSALAPTATTTRAPASSTPEASAFAVGSKPLKRITTKSTAGASDHEAAAANLGRAEELYRRAATTQDESQRVKLIKEAAELGYPLAQNDLGWRYHKGNGVAKNDEHAYIWVRKAAKQGLAQAQYWLAFFYGTGKGVAENKGKAFEYYHKAAEQGHVDGMTTIGYMYQHGVCTSKDYNKAMKWSLRAAEHGNKDAMYDVGTLYERGLGVPPDLNKAMDWYDRASRRGHDQARKKVMGLMPLLQGGGGGGGGGPRRRNMEGFFSPVPPPFGPGFGNPSRPKKSSGKMILPMSNLNYYPAPPLSTEGSSWSGPQAPTEFDDLTTGPNNAMIEQFLYNPDRKGHKAQQDKK